MSDVKSYRDLVAWQKSFRTGLAIYELTKAFPDYERFGLSNQLRRSAVSVASNIAEGYGRQSTSDYIRFLRVARGSLYELETQILFATELRYIEQHVAESVLENLAECGRILAGLIRSLEFRS